MSPVGYMALAVQAAVEETGFLVEGWTVEQGSLLWDYKGTPSSLQVATGLAFGPYAAVYAGGFYLDNGLQAAGVVKLQP
jgi:hypothetical protein